MTAACDCVRNPGAPTFAPPPSPVSKALRAGAHATTLAALALFGWSSSLHAQTQAAWQWVGRQGIVQVVLVPSAEITDEAAYLAQIERLCQPEQTCFINFYANSAGVAVSLPLPDAVAAEATATYRRTAKKGAEMLQWSCRLKLAAAKCF